jgi:two-component system, chemotaxis family, CheB/CheR fusion protein
MAREVNLKALLQELAEERNFDFRGYKKTSLERRFRRRMFQVKQKSYSEYSDYIRSHPEEINQLLSTLLINVTQFFRDPPAWEILRHELLPNILDKIKPGHSFRAWAAGCATGEEAYSIAMLVAEHLGPRLPEYDVKIYATDIDEEALNAARRGEYPIEAVRSIRAEWREKYFHGSKMLRVNRDLRRLVIFGVSNLAQDAPISHVNLLTCRNLLIYFDPPLQKQILSRLHYALEPGGILFLGRAESQLANSSQFKRLNARWRIFQRIYADLPAAEPIAEKQEREAAPMSPAPEHSQETQALRHNERHLLETLRVGILALAEDDTIVHNNPAVLALCGLAPANLAGKRLADTDLHIRIPELEAQLQATRVNQATRLNNESSRFPTRIRAGREERLLEVTIRPLFSEGRRNGSLVYIDDQTVQEKLETTVEELESTSEELQSANEELETTNEELQSTNEELETTNEELQSTNEELETTNEELQSLNEELETTNQELEERTKELDQVNSVYVQTLEKVRVPVMLVNHDRRIEFWNIMALKMFGFKNKPPMDITIDQLPLPRALKAGLIRRHALVLEKEQPMVARAQFLGDSVGSIADIHLSLIPGDDKSTNVLMIFEPKGGIGVTREKKTAKIAKNK